VGDIETVANDVIDVIQDTNENPAEGDNDEIEIDL
jgi:hypothetical protein